MKKMRIFLYALIILIPLCVAAFWSGLSVRHYTVTTDKFAPGQSVRAVLIADLHSYIWGNDQSPLISRIREQNPDIILLAGDIYDDRTPSKGTELFLAEIVEIAPVFYVTGNHEYWTWEIERVKELFRSFGVTVLEDKYVEVTINDISLIIAGVCDSECVAIGSSQKSPTAPSAFGELPDREEFKIFIIHRPEQAWWYTEYGFDLVVSGHSHGGQVRIPFLVNGLYAPGQGFLPSIAGGMFETPDFTHIVSRGASPAHPRLPRVFNPPEIVVIDIAVAL